MRKKKSYVLFIIFLLLPLIHLFDNQLLANTAPISSENEPIEINPLSTDFGIIVCSIYFSNSGYLKTTRISP